MKLGIIGDDFTGSSDIANNLKKSGMQVSMYAGIPHSKAKEEQDHSSDAIVIATEWEEFRSVDWSKISKLMRSPKWLFDTRGITNFHDLEKYNINYWKIGLGDSSFN